MGLLATIKRYYHLTKPGIVKSNVMTAAGGFLVVGWQFDWSVLVGVVAGTALVVACGTVLNNYLDRGIDAKMARTQQRALVSGAISVPAALTYGAVLGAVGFGLLVWLTNWRVVALGVVGLVFYVLVYGWAKRHTPHSTLIGTVSGATPIVAGYVAAAGRFDVGALLLFLVMVAWQMPHFYAIALYRQKEYRAAGLPLLPIVRGSRRTQMEMLLYAFLFVVAVELLSILNFTGLSFLVVMSGLGLYWLWRGVKGFDNQDQIIWGKQMFGLSLVILLALSIMLAFEPILP